MSTSHTLSLPLSAAIEICPHLGIEEDARTILGYPSPWNYCHRCKPISAVKKSYQRTTCFSSAHKSCPVAASATPEPLPDELRVPRKALK